MSTASLIAHQARYDLRTFMRDPRARVFTLAVPVIMLVFFGAVFKHQSFTAGGTSILGTVYYLSRMIVLGISSVAMSNMVITLVAKRESGALKRRRATPVRPVALIGGDVVTCEVSAITIGIVLALIGVLGFSVHLSAVTAGAVLVAVVVGTAALCAVAYAVSTFLVSVESTGPVIMIMTILLNIISGIYVPDSIFPAWLRDLALVLPLRPLALTVTAAVDPASNGGHSWAWGYLGIVALWGIAAGALAVRRFTWSPRQQ